jgi:hypothetical protein
VLTGLRALIVVAFVLSAIAGAATPAYAHNALTGSDPEDGATVAQGPAEVQLRFLASLDPEQSELAVTGPDGDSALAGDPAFDGSRVTVPLTATLAGQYEIAYGVLSNDGHWVEGTVEFTVTEGEQPVAPAPTAEPVPSPTAGSGPVGRATESAGPPASPAAAASTGGLADRGGWFWVLVAVAVVLLAGGGYGGQRWWRTRSVT